MKTNMFCALCGKEEAAANKLPPGWHETVDLIFQLKTTLIYLGEVWQVIGNENPICPDHPVKMLAGRATLYLKESA